MHGDGRQGEGQVPVAELDEAVDAHFRVLTRVRPCSGATGAAEAGRGQPHGAAGDDQQCLADQGKHGEAADC